MKILAIDTTAAAASAAICDDNFLLGEYFINIKQTHSQTLMPMVGNLLKSSGTKPSDIGLFAVSCGPGSFTGVRIGVAAIKGMALPFNTPCVAVSSLESLALNIASVDGVICAVMDARRGQFYNALFEPCDGYVKRLTSDRAIDFSSLKNDIMESVSRGKKVFLVGDGSQLCYNMFNKTVVEGVILAPKNFVYARASSVAISGYKHFLSGETVSADKLLPSYLRLPQAERELKAKLKK